MGYEILMSVLALKSYFPKTKQVDIIQCLCDGISSWPDTLLIQVLLFPFMLCDANKNNYNSDSA